MNEQRAFFNVMPRQKVLEILIEISVKIKVTLSKKPKAQGITVRICILGSYLHQNKQDICGLLIRAAIKDNLKRRENMYIWKISTENIT